MGIEALSILAGIARILPSCFALIVLVLGEQVPLWACTAHFGAQWHFKAFEGFAARASDLLLYSAP